MSTTAFDPVGTGTDILVPYPDPPPRHPDEMRSFRHLTNTGGAHYLGMHFRNPTTLIAGELYLVPEPGRGTRGLRVPDMMVAFDVNPEACYRGQRLRDLRTGQAARLRARGRLGIHRPRHGIPVESTTLD